MSRGRLHSANPNSVVEDVGKAMNELVSSMGLLQTGFVKRTKGKSNRAVLVGIGGFTKSSSRYLQRCIQLRSSYAYWIGSGAGSSKSGGGRLTAALAEEAALFCKAYITSENVRDEFAVGLQPDYRDLTPKYEEWKRSVAPSKGMFSMSGALVDAFGARKRGGQAILGVSATAMVRPIVVYGDGKQRLKDKVYVLDYASAIEHGWGNQPKRPIQQAAVLAWVYTANVAWGDMFRKRLSSMFREDTSLTSSTDDINYGQGAADSKRTPDQFAEYKQEMLIKTSKLVHENLAEGADLSNLAEDLGRFLGPMHTTEEMVKVWKAMVSGKIVTRV